MSKRAQTATDDSASFRAKKSKPKNSRSPNSISSVKSYGSVSYSPDDTGIDQQFDMANQIKELYMKVNIDRANDIFYHLVENKIDFLDRTRFDLSAYNFQKDLMYPATLINIMTRLSNLKILSYIPKTYTIKDVQSDIYKTYTSDEVQNYINYILSIFDTMGIKVLYLICNDNKYYLSPLNIRYLRDNIRKNNINTDHMDLTFIKSNNKELRQKFNIQRGNTISIDASSYDVIITSAAFTEFTKNINNIIVNINHTEFMHHKSSILGSNQFIKKILRPSHDDSHLISLNKCYNYMMVNTTWSPFNIYQVENFVPGVERYYYFDEDNNVINEINLSDIHKNNTTVYYSHYKVDRYFDLTFYNNIHFFTAKRRSDSLSKHSRTRNTENTMMIPEVSVCADMYFPDNNYGFCWFSCIINSLFYADDISTIFLNKAVGQMDKTLEYIKGFYDKGYQTFDMQSSRDLKKFVIHLIRLFTFIYCSFSILSKNQIDRIRNKQKWLEIYNHVTGDYYLYIYVFMIALSKVIKPVP
jgi:hypothetical protein